jgi:hypothetical protein
MKQNLLLSLQPFKRSTVTINSRRTQDVDTTGLKMNLHISYQPGSDLDREVCAQNVAGSRHYDHQGNHAPHPVQLNQPPTKYNLPSAGPLGLTHRQHKNQYVFF